MSKEILFDKYGNEIVKLEVKYNNKLQSICMNDFRIGGCKWNDIDNGSFLTLTINKKDLIDQLVENEVKYDYDEDENGETVKQVIVDNEKYIDIEYFARTKADLEAKLAEKEKELQIFKELKAEELGSAVIRVSEHLAEAIKNIDFVTLLDIAQRVKQFTIAELEKVKDLVEEKSTISSPFGTLKIYASDVSAIIDQQIEELTHQHEDKGE